MLPRRFPFFHRTSSCRRASAISSASVSPSMSAVSMSTADGDGAVFSGYFRWANFVRRPSALRSYDRTVQVSPVSSRFTKFVAKRC
jgi:hypothetical protein